MRLPHVTPFTKEPIYFFTACTAHRRAILACETVHACLRTIWTRSHEYDGWCVGCYVIMPDHVHLFARPSPDAKQRANWLKAWKSLSARTLCRQLKVAPPLWQPDTFDHILRSVDSYGEKWEYVRANPIRAGLARTPDEWPWQGEIHRLGF